jgi:hypothetical protein
MRIAILSAGTNIFPGATGVGVFLPSPTGETQLNGGITQLWSLDEIKNADTGKECDFLTEDEKATLVLINLARIYPKKFAEHYLKPYRRAFTGNIVSRPGGINLLTSEGAAAVTDCIDHMTGRAPARALAPSAGLSHAARDHAADQGPSGEMGHVGSDGSTLSERISMHGKWGGYCGENISYGHEDPTEILISLLVDDGVPSRGHRDNLLKGVFNKVGIAIGPHEKYGHMCVMDFAGTYAEKGAEK